MKTVDVYADEKSEDERLIEAGETLGIGKLTPEQAAKLRQTLAIFMKMSPARLKTLLAEDEQA